MMRRWQSRKKRKKNGKYNVLVHMPNKGAAFNLIIIILMSFIRLFLEKIESCQRSLKTSRAVRQRRSLMYTKLKPLSSITEVKRAQSSPGIHSSSYEQMVAENKALAEETMQDIFHFESSLKRRPDLPSIGVAHSLSSTTVSDKPIVVSQTIVLL